MTVNDRLFALQIPKVIPDKITAQYEDQERIKQMKESLARGELTFKKPEGTDRRYLHIKDVKSVQYQRNPNKAEANIEPQLDSTVRFKAKQVSKEAKNPYDEIINQKVAKDGEMPKFTF